MGLVLCLDQSISRRRLWSPKDLFSAVEAPPVIPPTRSGQDTQEQQPLEVPLAVGGISSDQVTHVRGPGTITRLSLKARMQNIHVEGPLGLETRGTVAISGQRSERFKE